MGAHAKQLQDCLEMDAYYLLAKFMLSLRLVIVFVSLDRSEEMAKLANSTNGSLCLFDMGNRAALERLQSSPISKYTARERGPAC